MKSSDNSGEHDVTWFEEQMEHIQHVCNLPEVEIIKMKGRVMNPSLDYLYQYPVKEVLPKEDGSGYGIEFGGGPENSGKGSIIGIESTGEVPDLSNRALLTTVFSETETRMIFGNIDKVTMAIVDRVEVVVAPTDYFIIDPRFEGEAFYPGRPQLEVERPTTVASRFADGPDELSEADDLGDMPDMPNGQT